MHLVQLKRTDGIVSRWYRELSPNTTVNTRNTAQSSSSILSTRKIGDRQLVRLADGANASKGAPAFVYKIKGRVLATDAVLCAPKMELRNQIHMLLLHSLAVHV